MTSRLGSFKGSPPERGQDENRTGGRRRRLSDLQGEAC